MEDLLNYWRERVSIIMKVVVVVPTYNERENIASLLSQLTQALGVVKNHAISYLVVDDTSPDGTRDAVVAYKKTHKTLK